jgi:hypothetical protein
LRRRRAFALGRRSSRAYLFAVSPLDLPDPPTQRSNRMKDVAKGVMGVKNNEVRYRYVLKQDINKQV